ncbi:hypothetical protein ING2E5A_0264 [Petrimonas mucosa]|uniref:Uncharacterized protein n=1 Tax=Petrimonas mucosa TaxID=1642646 RepID=A0A1G4G3J5_9BACT|nr:hypothetical protein ING2E5A_0264 [Petrimonas mucosa]
MIGLNKANYSVGNDDRPLKSQHNAVCNEEKTGYKIDIPYFFYLFGNKGNDKKCHCQISYNFYNIHLN